MSHDRCRDRRRARPLDMIVDVVVVLNIATVIAVVVAVQCLDRRLTVTTTIDVLRSVAIPTTTVAVAALETT